jgi:hypothetical protein
MLVNASKTALKGLWAVTKLPFKIVGALSVGTARSTLFAVIMSYIVLGLSPPQIWDTILGFDAYVQEHGLDADNVHLAPQWGTISQITAWLGSFMFAQAVDQVLVVLEKSAGHMLNATRRLFGWPVPEKETKQSSLLLRALKLAVFTSIISRQFAVGAHSESVFSSVVTASGVIQMILLFEKTFLAALGVLGRGVKRGAAKTLSWAKRNPALAFSTVVLSTLMIMDRTSRAAQTDACRALHVDDTASWIGAGVDKSRLKKTYYEASLYVHPDKAIRACSPESDACHNWRGDVDTTHPEARDVLTERFRKVTDAKDVLKAMLDKGQGTVCGGSVTRSLDDTKKIATSMVDMLTSTVTVIANRLGGGAKGSTEFDGFHDRQGGVANQISFQ